MPFLGDYMLPSPLLLFKPEKSADFLERSFTLKKTFLMEVGHDVYIDHSMYDISHRIHVWYIYLHLVDFYGKCR